MKSTAQPMEREETPRGFSVFSNYLPSLDRWLAKRAAVKGLAAETERLDAKAVEWEKRGHWQMAGKCKELAAKMAERSLDVTFMRETLMKRDTLLREAIVDYAVEIGDAGRYDPAVEFSMYLVAKKLGHAALAKQHMDKAMKIFNSLYIDRDLEALIRLNRLKKDFLYEIWAGEASDALKIASEALIVARRIGGPQGRIGDETESWVEQRIAERYAASRCP